MENMYSKWLLVSDIDGTLNDKKMKLPLNNKEAVNRYVSNGGNFTLCSGRNLQSLSIHYEKLNIETPAIILNGAGIYDFKTRRLIDFSPISSEGEKLILELYKRFKSVQLTVYGIDTLYLVGGFCFYGLTIAKMDSLNYEVCRNISKIPRGVWGKVTFFGPRKTVKKIKEIISSDEYVEHLGCFFTSPYGLEIVCKDVNKGSAVSKLAERLGVAHCNTAAVGDYYNDVDMLKSVAHPVCCGQAPDDIKSLCEYVACHCNDGAVYDFINYIEKNYIL